MPCFHFALSLMSSAFLGGTLAFETPQLPEVTWDKMLLLGESFLNASEGEQLYEPSVAAFPWRVSDTPAPLDAEELEILRRMKTSIIVPPADPAPATANEEYSYIYEVESPAESSDRDQGNGPIFVDTTMGTVSDATTDADIDDDSDWEEYPATDETFSPDTGLSSMIDGTLGVLERSTADLSVVFRNISVQISRLRGSF